MRTTLDLPEDLLEETMKLSQTKSKTSAIILSLQELINKKRIEQLSVLSIIFVLFMAENFQSLTGR